MSCHPDSGSLNVILLFAFFELCQECWTARAISTMHFSVEFGDGGVCMGWVGGESSYG